MEEKLKLPSPEGSSGPEERPPIFDAGLLGLVLIARFHQIPATAEGLRHQFAPLAKKLGEPSVFGDEEILWAAKHLGFRAKAAVLEAGRLDNSLMPILAKTRQGGYFIIVQNQLAESPAPVSSATPEKFSLIHLLAPTGGGARKVGLKDLAELWNGEALLLSPRRSPFFGLPREFNLKWFVPSFIKYRRLFGEVFLASFLLQLFGLVTPLFFQVVMDKVLVHQALTTLDVLALGFLAASIFEVVLGGLRNYIFSHTTTRVDVELGARLFGHLMALPLGWFQARQAGQSVARVRELDSLRNFITSTALTLVIDLGFTFVFFAVMFFYSPTFTLVVLGSLPFYIGLSVFITPILKHRLDKKSESFT